MKKILALLFAIFTACCGTFAQTATNDFYDDAETITLPGATGVEVTGEISNPGTVQFSTLPVRSVIVKETVLKDGKDSFVGAYRYDGYSLYDILNKFILAKKNKAEFNPIIDLYVEVSNNKGESVVISWGEIYYPIHRHEIIIANKVMHIVPSKTKDLWPLPAESRLVVASDLITERNISNPTKITIHSLNASYKVEREMSPLFSPEFSILNGDKKETVIKQLPSGLCMNTYPTIFYGRGKGIHSVTPFTGVKLKDVAGKYFPVTRENLQKGIFVFAGKDGYRCACTFSELMNRNDQAEFMLIDKGKDADGGRFSIFPAADFFSDRAVKALTEIKLIKE